MNSGNFLRPVEQNEPASERTKRELLTIIMTKANEAYNSLPYPRTTRLFSDDYSRIVCLTDWTPEGRYYDPPVAAEVIFYEKNLDGVDVQTCYEFMERPDGLSLAKYVEMSPAKDEETKQSERAAMKLLSELMEEGGGLNNLQAFLDTMPEEQKQLQDEERAHEEKEWNDARAFADEVGTSVVLESEALALLDMIQSADWPSDPSQ